VSNPTNHESLPQKQLDSWKEIAAYLRCAERTAKRWEKTRGLPIHRLPGGVSQVFAFCGELDSWRAGTVEQQADGEAPAPFTISDEQSPVALSDPPSLEGSSLIARLAPYFSAGVDRRSLVPRLGIMAACLAAVAVFLFIHRSSTPKILGGQAQLSRQYVSKVANVDSMYLQGMYLFGKRTPESLLEARKTLSDTVRRDPSDAPAWSGLAQTATILCAYGIDDGLPQRQFARDAAERALLLDTGLAEPHAVLGFSDFFWLGNAKAAEREFEEALRLNANSAYARSSYGTILTYEARYPEAVAQLTEAQRLDPSSTPILASRALAIGLSGNRDEALKLLGQVGENNPIANVRYDRAILSLVQPRRLDVYLREEIELNALAHRDENVRMYAAAQRAFLRGGEPAMWHSILASDRKVPIGFALMAGAYAATGQNAAALATIESAKEGELLCGLPMDPLLIPLRQDPRFNRALSSAGL
jgi:tetratricopeptide (TPR) repeat protein